MATFPDRQDPVLFKDLELRADRFYFLYVGEIKAYGLNPFLIPCLEGLFGQPVDFLAVVPDVLAHYPYKNLLVLNAESYGWRQEGLLVNCRPSSGQFAHMVSLSEVVRRILEQILQRQPGVYIHVFESRPEMTLTDGERVHLLGPEPAVAYGLNNKLHQFEMALQIGIPVPEGACCRNLEEALDLAEIFFRSGEQVFISEPYSAAGSNSIFASSREEILQRFSDPESPYLLTRRIPHRHDPTVLGVVANDQDVYLASVADQCMEGNRYRGSSFPTLLNGDLVEQLKGYTRRIGSHIGSRGYRGIFGCDYIVDDHGHAYFVEINARKQGTTLETALTMLHRMQGHPTLLELEFQAITRGSLPHGLVEMDSTQSDICWATYNVKCQRDVMVTRAIPRPCSEPALFGRVHEEVGFRAGALVEDHLGPRIYQRAGGFVGRCIVVGKSLPEVHQCLNLTRREVESTVIPWDH